MLAGTLSTAALVILVGACTRSQDPANGPVDTPVFVLANPERIGSEIEWGDLEEFDVRASDGAVVGLDRYASRIHVMGIAGATSFGRAGEGPDEILGPGPIVATAETIVLISQGRISAWDYRGTIVNTAHSRGALSAFQWGPDHVAARGRDTGAGVPLHHDRIDLWRADLSGDPRLLFRDADLADFPTDSLTGDKIGAPELGLIAMMRADTSPLIRIDPEEGSIVRYPPIDREQAEWTPEEWTRYMRRAYTSGLYESPMPQMREMFLNALSRPVESNPQFDKRLIPYESSVGLHDQGQIWVMMGVPLEERTVIDVLDPMGEKLGSVHLPALVVEQIRLKGDWLVALSFDDLDRPELRRYPIGAVVDSLERGQPRRTP